MNGIISEEQICEYACMLYFMSMLIQAFFVAVTDRDRFSLLVGTGIPLMLVFLLICINPRKYINYTFLGIILFIIGFFALTYIFHPEYYEYYIKEGYGVKDIFIPYRGVFTLLFVMLLDDPVKIRRCVRYAGWFMFIFFGWMIFQAYTRGYWLGVGVQNNAKMSYSVSFGYMVLPYCLVWMNDALKYKRGADIAGALISFIMILIGGSRGTIVFIAGFLILYFVRSFIKSAHKGRMLVLFICVFTLIRVLYRHVLSAVQRVMSMFGMSSRFVNTMLNGTVTNDNNRFKIWKAAFDMIRQNPFGAGAFGTRPVISPYVYSGYPHNIILEILAEFGVIPGVIILGFLAYYSIKILFFSEDEEWTHLFLPFFAAACSLLLSMTFWTSTPFWAAVGIGIGYFRCIRKRKEEGIMNLKPELGALHK